MDSTQAFDTHRPRLYGLAYRMLGTRSDTEDVLQDAFLRWQAVDSAGLQSAEAWLVTVVTRLAIDRLRAAKTERAAYAGMWLPEPLVQAADSAPAAEALLEHCDDLSMAFLLLLERLAPEERAALLLRQVFEEDYADIAALLGKSEANCRQLVHRARQRVREDRPRFSVHASDHRRLLEKFVAAAQSGRRADLMALFADEVQLIGDGGGKVLSVGRPLHGSDRVARLFHVVQRSHGASLHYSVASINGQPGLLRWHEGAIEAALSIVSDGERIHALYVVRNPDKLRHITAGTVTNDMSRAS